MVVENRQAQHSANDRRLWEDVFPLYPNVAMTDSKYRKYRCRKCGSKVESNIPYEAQSDWNSTNCVPAMKNTVWFCMNDDCGNMCAGNPLIFGEGKGDAIWLFDCDGEIGRVKE